MVAEKLAISNPLTIRTSGHQTVQFNETEPIGSKIIKWRIQIHMRLAVRPSLSNFTQKDNQEGDREREIEKESRK